MAVNFPSNPTNGQTVTVSGITYAYDSTQGVWSDNPQGLTQAIDALTDVDTSTSAPTNGQILQWNSTDSEWQPADSSAGVTVYATIDDLPLTGVTEGSMALVDSTDKLYIFSDAGWYSITLVNTTPSISGVSATYTLAADGTATTVTVTATDPEGVPLTYSIVSDTSGNIATVTQGTGSNTNQWTITPSTNTANAGNFTLVFRASDGVNVASASSTFTLQFAIENSNYTTALITSVGANNAVNNSFTDSSTNSHTITANGNVTQNTFSPYRHGGYSIQLDGSGDYLQVPQTAAARGTGDYTIECWVYNRTFSNYRFIFDARAGATATDDFMSITSSGYLRFRNNGVTETTTQPMSLNTWHHFAQVRNGTTLKVYVDGVEVASKTQSGNLSIANDFQIGGSSYEGPNEEIDGYIADFRIVLGTAVYTSAFTPPDERLSAITNTSLLTCHLPYIADGSTNSHAITVNGDTKTEAFSPYDHNGYSANDNGGSIYFDGSGDWLSVSDGSWITLGSSDFTIECWAYNTAASGSRQDLFGQGNSAGQAFSISTELYINSNRTVGGGVYVGSQAYLTSTATVPVNTWNHIVLARDGTTMRLYINGVQSATTSVGSGTVSDQSTDFSIGRVGEYNGLYFNGNISDFRFVKGTCVYPSGTTFTPPTAPLSAITNTSLLINGTNAGIIDKSQSVKTVSLNGGAKSSTTQTKYLTSSMYFDGDAYIKSDAGAELYGYTGAFTIEAWIYPTSISQYSNPIFNYGNSGSTGNDHFNFELGGGGILQVRWNQAYPVSASQASSTPLNTWTHVALTRDSSNNLKLWVGGTLADSATQSGGLPTAGANRTIIGSQSYSEGTASRSFNGYISDLRVTKGLARYTANFTPPSAALEG